MLALAHHFVAKYPGQPAAHLALSFAYIQIYKNAWPKNARHTKDLVAVEANMRLALKAAEDALRLDPNSESAQQAVQLLQRKYAGLPVRQ
jgi:hypothetical protein